MILRGSWSSTLLLIYFCPFFLCKSLQLFHGQRMPVRNISFEDTHIYSREFKSRIEGVNPGWCNSPSPSCYARIICNSESVLVLNPHVFIKKNCFREFCSTFFYNSKILWSSSSPELETPQKYWVSILYNRTKIASVGYGGQRCLNFLYVRIILQPSLYFDDFFKHK